MSIDSNLLTLYDFEKLRTEIFVCIDNTERIEEFTSHFQTEYKLMRKLALDFIDELNCEISEIENHEFYSKRRTSINSIYYLRKSHSLEDVSAYKLYGVANFKTQNALLNLIGFVESVEVLKKDAIAWVESFRLPLKTSKKQKALIEIWNDHLIKIEPIESWELEKALDFVDQDEDYASLSESTYQSLKDLERIQRIVDSNSAPFHQFPIENIETVFDSKCSEILSNLARMDEILDSVNQYLFENRFGS
jgi:hypothetical protein